MSIEITQDNSESGQSPLLEGSSNFDNTGTLPLDSQGSKLRPLTGKEYKYVKARMEGMTKKDAVKAAYDVKPDIKHHTLEEMARKIEQRAPVLAILEKQSERAQELLGALMEDTASLSKTGTKEGAMYAGVAERVINSLLDRVHGKAKQSIDVTSRAVNINVDLSK